MEKNNQIDSIKKGFTKATPIIIRAISFFVILTSVIAILFYGYILVFNSDILSHEISLVANHFLSLVNYILLEILIFTMIIIGAILILYSNKKGFIIIAAGVVSLLIMNTLYFEKIDWFNSSVTIIILLLIIISWKINK